METSFACETNAISIEFDREHYGDISYMYDKNILTTLRQETVVSIEMK